MRTTVDIPDPLYRELKSKAAKEGRSVKELILRGVEEELRPDTRGHKKKTKSLKTVRLPILGSKEPGVLKLDNERIFDLIGFP
jgi:Ribbon-helix-helix protein, copG family